MITRCLECDSYYSGGPLGLPSVEIEAAYTDGHIVTVPAIGPSFFFCRKCKSVFHWESVEEYARENPIGMKSLLLRETVMPSSSELLNATKKEHMQEDELHLRLIAWRIDNDKWRDQTDSRKLEPSQRPDSWHDNLKRLQEIENEPIVVAELYREAENFMRAAEILHDLALSDCHAWEKESGDKQAFDMAFGDRFESRNLFRDNEASFIKRLVDESNPFVQKYR